MLLVFQLCQDTTLWATVKERDSINRSIITKTNVYDESNSKQRE